MEERARAEAAAKQKPTQDATPADKAQDSFTDPESPIMKGPDGFVQAYNAQIPVEGVGPLIVGQAVTQDGNDQRPLQAMIETVAAQAADPPAQVPADSGYCSDENLTYTATQ